MRKVCIFILSVLMLLAVSCELGEYITGVRPLSDDRFNGTFRYYRHWEDSYGIEEITIEYVYIFNGTNKVEKILHYEKYTIAGGWVYSGDYPGDVDSYTMEASIDGGRLRLKLWGYSDGDWIDNNPYLFDDEGITLTLIDYWDTADHLVLHKIP